MQDSCWGRIDQIVCVLCDVGIDLFDNTLEVSIIYDRTREAVSPVVGNKGRSSYVAAEIKPQGKTPSIESTPESAVASLSLCCLNIISVNLPFVRELPFTIDDTESNVLIRWPCTEVQKDGFIIPWFFDNFVCRCFRLVNEIWVEYVELHKLAL